LKQYPTIDRDFHSGPFYVFDKLDGSNVRTEWTRKKGFGKFGRRHGLLDDTNPLLSERAPTLILDKYGDDLHDVFKRMRVERVTAFFEFWGPNSFAGNHEESDEQTVTLLDVIPYKQGMLEPAKFLRQFGHLDLPALLHQGNVTQAMVQQIKTGTLPGMTFEGVVCKGHYERKLGRPVMFKIKNSAWIDKLRAFCGNNETLFQRML